MQTSVDSSLLLGGAAEGSLGQRWQHVEWKLVIACRCRIALLIGIDPHCLLLESGEELWDDLANSRESIEGGFKRRGRFSRIYASIVSASLSVKLHCWVHILGFLSSWGRRWIVPKCPLLNYPLFLFPENKRGLL